MFISQVELRTGIFILLPEITLRNGLLKEFDPFEAGVKIVSWWLRLNVHIACVEF